MLAKPQRQAPESAATSDAGDNESERKKREAEEKEADKARKREEKKAEMRAQREAQKNDPVYKAKDFAARLNKDSGDSNSLAKRLQAATGGLAKNLVEELEKDSKMLDEAYKSLNEYINTEDMPKIKTTMEEAAEIAKTYQKHERLARAQISVVDKGPCEKGAKKVR